MNKVEKILETYEDFELAFLLKFKVNNYLPESKQKIEKEVANRKLTDQDLQNLIDKQLNIPFNPDCKKGCCPRCKSNKILKIDKNVRDIHHRGLLTALYLEGKLDSYTHFKCSICGYDINPGDDNAFSLWESIQAIFKNKRI